MTKLLQATPVPRSCCVLVASGCVTGAPVTGQGGHVWFGLAAGHNSSACADFYGSASATTGRLLWHAAISACTTTPMTGPFFSPSGAYVTLAGTGASAMVLKDTER